MSKKKKLTSTNGAPVVDNQNVITAGKKGLMVLQDGKGVADVRGIPVEEA